MGQRVYLWSSAGGAYATAAAHSSITQTMDTYSYVIDSMGGDSVGGLDEAFG